MTDMITTITNKSNEFGTSYNFDSRSQNNKFFKVQVYCVTGCTNTYSTCF